MLSVDGEKPALPIPITQTKVHLVLGTLDVIHTLSWYIYIYIFFFIYINYIYIYMCVCVCLSTYLSLDLFMSWDLTHPPQRITPRLEDIVSDE